MAPADCLLVRLRELHERYMAAHHQAMRASGHSDLKARARIILTERLILQDHERAIAELKQALLLAPTRR